MKKIFLIIMINIALFGTDISLEQKIFDKVLFGVFNKENILVYTDDRYIKKNIKNSMILKLTDKVKYADIVLVGDDSSFYKNTYKKPIFTSSRKVFRTNNDAIGAFYWRKGRPQIVFLKERIDKFNLDLSKDLDKYIFDEL